MSTKKVSPWKKVTGKKARGCRAGGSDKHKSDKKTKEYPDGKIKKRKYRTNLL
jgi:hypothetical protein